MKLQSQIFFLAPLILMGVSACNRAYEQPELYSQDEISQDYSASYVDAAAAAPKDGKEQTKVEAHFRAPTKANPHLRFNSERLMHNRSEGEKNKEIEDIAKNDPEKAKKHVPSEHAEVPVDGSSVYSRTIAYKHLANTLKFKLGGKTYENHLDIEPIEIPDYAKTIDKHSDFTLAWKEKPVLEGEEIELFLLPMSGSTTPLVTVKTSVVGDKSITISHDQLENIPDDTVRIILQRKAKHPLQEGVSKGTGSLQTSYRTGMNDVMLGGD